jgi:RND family efflux transporter MFP subunit
MAKTGNDSASRGAGLQMGLKLIDEHDFVHEGHMDFVDNAIDRSTGTIRGRAVYANPNNVFTPGMFARVRVTGSPPYEALLVPDAAVGTEQTRKFVLTVNADNAVVPKYVTLGQTTGDNLRVIKDGVAADDRIIVNGLMRARPGQKVTPQEEGKPGAAPAQGANPPQKPK